MSDRVGVVAVLVALAGCISPKIAFTGAAVTPAEVAVGKSCTLQTSIADRHGIIDSVIAVVREFPELEIELFDDGLEGDELAGDGIWSCRLDVPATATPGTYHFEIRAYDDAGNEILVRSKAGSYVALATGTSVVIVY